MDHACGVGAKIAGIPMAVYRITNNSNGDWLQPANIALKLPVDRAPMRRTDPSFESSMRMDVFWYELLVDANPLLLGDVLVSLDTVYNAGSTVVNFDTTEFIGMCFANHSPIKHALAARINTTAKLYRPSNAPTTEVNGLNYFDNTLPQELPIVCVNGQFTTGAITDTASNIPIGVMPLTNTGAIYSAPTANMPSQERRRIYVPPLPGFVPKASDKLVLASGTRYFIVSNYVQDSGAVGGQYMIEKYVSGSGGE